MGIRWRSPTQLLIHQSPAILWIIVKLVPSDLVGEPRPYPCFVIATTLTNLTTSTTQKWVYFDNVLHRDSGLSSIENLLSIYSTGIKGDGSADASCRLVYQHSVLTFIKIRIMYRAEVRSDMAVEEPLR